MKKYPSGDVPIGSLDICFRIMESIHEDSSLSLSEIATQLDVSDSTAHRHLVSMRRFGFVRKEGSEFKTGFRFLELGAQTRQQEAVYRIAKPKIKQLAEETGEIGHLMTESDGIGVRLCSRRGEKSVSTNTMVGEHVFLHTNSTGKAILANLSESRREEIIEETQLPEQTEHTITDPAQLRERLREIRERGYAFNKDERIKGLRAVGVPIEGQNGEAVAAVSVSGPSKRFNGEWFRSELPATVSEVANEIELDLKYSWNS